MSIFRLPRNVLGKVLVVLFWWPAAIAIWLMWFVVIGWWWLLITEPYARITVNVYPDGRR